MTTEGLQTELKLEIQPTEGWSELEVWTQLVNYWLKQKTPIAFSVRLKEDPEYHKVIFQVSRIQSRITRLKKKQKYWTHLRRDWTDGDAKITQMLKIIWKTVLKSAIMTTFQNWMGR